jgi:hypothetical protein
MTEDPKADAPAGTFSQPQFDVLSRHSWNDSVRHPGLTEQREAKCYGKHGILRKEDSE